MKLLILILVVLLLGALLFPRSIPRFLRALGRAVGGAGRAGREIASGEEVSGSPLARYEARAGQILEMRVLAEHPAAAAPALQARAKEIGARLARHARRREIPYRFTVVHGEEPNAFAIAGGAVLVTDAMLELCGSDDHRLAGVLAHELSHIDHRHALRNLAAGAAVRSGLRVLSFGRGAILSRVVGGMETLLSQGYRQDQEFEADLTGSRLAARAGFRADGLARLLADLATRAPDGEGPLAEVLSYFNSHPPVGARIERLRGVRAT